MTCRCTNEAGDSDCLLHPTCPGCGEDLMDTEIARHVRTLAADLLRTRVESERRRVDRDEALSATTTEGLPASEWVARTGRYAAEAARLREALRGTLDALDRLMGDSDLPDDDSPELRAMQAGLAALEGRCQRCGGGTDVIIGHSMADGICPGCATIARLREALEEIADGDGRCNSSLGPGCDVQCQWTARAALADEDS